MLSTLHHHTTTSQPQATQLAPSSSTTSATDPGTRGETRSGVPVEVLPSQAPKARGAHDPSGDKDKIRPLSDRSVQAEHDGSTDPVPLPMDTKEGILAKTINTTAEPALRSTSRLLERVCDSKTPVNVDLQRDHLVMVSDKYLLHLNCEPGDFPLNLRSDEYDLETCKDIARELGARLVQGDDPEKPVSHYLIDRACPTSITSKRQFSLEVQDKVRDGEPIIIDNCHVLFADGESLLADPERLASSNLSAGDHRALILRGHFDYGTDTPGLIVSPMQMPRHVWNWKEHDTSESFLSRPIWRIGDDPEFIEPSSLTSDRGIMKAIAKQASHNKTHVETMAVSLSTPVWVALPKLDRSISPETSFHRSMIPGLGRPALENVLMAKVDKVSPMPSNHLKRIVIFGSPLIIGKDVIGYWMGPNTDYWAMIRHLAIPMLSMVQQHIKISDIDSSIVVIMASNEYARGIPNVLLRMKIGSDHFDDIGVSLYILDASNHQLDGVLNFACTPEWGEKGTTRCDALPRLSGDTRTGLDDKKASGAVQSEPDHRGTDPVRDAHKILSQYDSTTTLALQDLADSMRTVVHEALAALLEVGDDFSCSDDDQHNLLSTLDNYVQIRQALREVRLAHAKKLKKRGAEASLLKQEDPAVKRDIVTRAWYLSSMQNILAEGEQCELDRLLSKIRLTRDQSGVGPTRSLLKKALETVHQSAAARPEDVRKISLAAMEKLAPRVGRATARPSPAEIAIIRDEDSASLVKALPPVTSTPSSQVLDLMAQRIRELDVQKQQQPPKEPLPPARVQFETKLNSIRTGPRSSVPQPIKQPLPKPATASTPVTTSTPVTAPEPPKPTRLEEQAAKLQRHLEKQIERGSSHGSSGDSSSGSASASRSPWNVSLASSGASAGSAPQSAPASVSSITPAQKTKALQTPIERFRDAIRVMQDLDLTLTRIKGSHAQFTADGRSTATIPGAALVSQKIPKHTQRDIQASIKRM